MQSILKLAIAAIFSLSIVNVYADADADADADAKPAKKKAKPGKAIPAPAKPVKTDLTGTFSAKNDKVTFNSTDGKTYTISKKQQVEAKKHLDKKVKVSCRVKSKKGKNDKEINTIVKILKVEAA